MAEHLTTESRNPASLHIDQLSPLEIARLMNHEDRRVVEAVEAELPRIARGIEMMAEALGSGHRVLYVGAGTSGRLGILDAVEWYPTFGVGEEGVEVILAGGVEAFLKAVEEAEDDEADGAAQVAQRARPGDLVVGISASGSTPFVLGAVRQARAMGVATLGLTCNRPSALEELADWTIAPVVGPEVVAGSTRLKAGTAEKMVLNILSTGAMIRLGKVYQNLMVDFRPTNAKLRERALRILQEVTGASREACQEAFEASHQQVKVAIVMLRCGLDREAAEQRLEEAGGFVQRALEGRPG
ncbi:MULTISPECIES: N-acetylmuramic acid 6-phosphate etherase [Limnochorda]|uniref:N-acetylmuramic acid 6-phosphate etherase n=1 Tax=Limnochorda TaxID=1676651 RepID=UPI00180DBBCC|nr:N-acetylmuramic acid 6-phosphate etherase [Limnochorda pilosa]MBO2487373.1 N-acetylmuramic acid 6-phosphate etherase [Bacillota bacterium]MBO2520142.1 N-acetylmuramic acid 6-phosphate etherase [Bacillota bacterium]NMA71970.1 N-acetylmuramic acid 6-phosphate etherase [Bacillota bacterium]